MHVEMRRLPRYFIKGRPASFGSARSAYKKLARRLIASEFDHLGWYADEGVASPALQAFRKKWMEFDMMGESWYPTKAYKDEVKRLMAQLEKEDREESIK